MDSKKFFTDYILKWFQLNRPELDIKRDEASEFYEEVKEDLFLEKDLEKKNNRDIKTEWIRNYLESYYFSPTNQICREVSEENEFYFNTSEMKKIGFIYTEEMECLILELKKQDWYKNYEDKESLLMNENFREQVRDFFRKRNWNNFVSVPITDPRPLKELIWQNPPNDENLVRYLLEKEGEEPSKINQFVDYIKKRKNNT